MLNICKYSTTFWNPLTISKRNLNSVEWNYANAVLITQFSPSLVICKNMRQSRKFWTFSARCWARNRTTSVATFRFTLPANPLTHWKYCPLNPESVAVPPDILDYPTSTDMVVREGSNVSLRCVAVGSPSPGIAWRREGGESIPLGNGLEGKITSTNKIGTVEST